VKQKKVNQLGGRQRSTVKPEEVLLLRKFACCWMLGGCV